MISGERQCRAVKIISAWLAAIAILFASAPAAYSAVDFRSSFIHDNFKRTFRVHLPEFTDSKNPLPLVIALHGRGGNGASMVLLTKSGFNTLSDRDGFIVVYPDGIDRNWNDGRSDQKADDRPHRKNIDDTGYISALIDTMIFRYNADPKRIFITGMSNGAMMSYRLACELSHKIAAIAPVAGSIPLMYLKKCRPEYPVSVLAINNIDDPVVPFHGGNVTGRPARTDLGRVISAGESADFWVKANKCVDLPFVSLESDNDPYDETRVTKRVFPGGSGGTEVILYSIEGGGHTWPGGFQYLPLFMIGRTSRDFDACEVIWNFFRRHSLHH